MEERRVPNAFVAGSSPVRETKMVRWPSGLRRMPGKYVSR